MVEKSTYDNAIFYPEFSNPERSARPLAIIRIKRMPDNEIQVTPDVGFTYLYVT